MLGTVGRRYYGMMEMVVAIGDAAEMQDKKLQQRMSKEAIYDGMTER